MKLVLNQLSHGFFARDGGQAWFAPAPRRQHISKRVRGQVLANVVQPVRLAIGDRIRNPLYTAVRAELRRVRHGRIEVLAKPQPKPAQRPHRGQQQGLAIVQRPVDHHAMIVELADAVAAKDSKRVFRLAAQLVDEAQAIAEQTNKVEDRWMTVDEVATYTNVCRMTIWRWRNEQGLKFTKVGNVVRIRRSELDAFLNKHTQG